MGDHTWFRRWVLGEISWRRALTSLGLIAGITYGYLLILGAFFADGKIFLPPPSSYEDGDQILKLITSDGIEISALYLPDPEATYTLLYSHGNAEDLGYARPELLGLNRIGFSIFAYDYRGYGTSQGRPSEAGAYLDIDAAYDYLTTDLEISPEQIILYGRSVGGGPSVDLASRQPVGGLILESTFVSAFRVLTRISILPFDKFTNIAKIQSIQAPVLILHGTEDNLIPIWHSQALYEKALEPKFSLWIEGAGHNDVSWVGGEEYIKALQDFAHYLEE